MKVSNTLNAIDGATALKLDESYQLEEQVLNDSLNNVENQTDTQNFQQTLADAKEVTNNLPSGVSIESASYMENNNFNENTSISSISEKSVSDEEYTPKLFSEEQNFYSEEINTSTSDQKNNDTEQLFDQDINEEEDFEIPAFLRKQKF